MSTPFVVQGCPAPVRRRLKMRALPTSVTARPTEEVLGAHS